MVCATRTGAEETMRGLPQEARVYRQKGYQAQRRGHLKSAMAYYQKATFLDPSYATPYNDLGVIYEVLGKLEDAKHAYKTCAEINPYCLGAYSNLAMLSERHDDLQTAVSYWRERAELGLPNDPWTQKAKKRVEAFVRSTREPTPSAAAPPTRLPSKTAPVSSVPQSADRPSTPAKATLKPVQQRPKPDQETKDELAQLHNANAALQAEMTRLTHANALLEVKAKEPAQLQREKDALETQLESLTRESRAERAKLYDDLGVAYTQLKVYSQAIEAYENSLNLDPNNAQAHYDVGLLYKHVHNDMEKARQHLRTYLQMTPNATDRKQLEALLGLMQRDAPSRLNNP